MADLKPGTVLDDRFEIAGVLGRGGMATVYLASDRLRGEKVALKVLYDHLAESPSMRARLRREVAASSRIRHPNALVAWDIHELDGHLALSMAFHAGSTLEDYVAEAHPIPAETLARMGAGLADALSAAHQQGIVHRDITPTNILVDPDGTAVLTDFGLARLEEAQTASMTGTMGTPGFAAPEVYDGERGDPRSDIYGLGAVLYLAATGKPPCGAHTVVEILRQQEAGAFAPVRDVRPDLPLDLCRLIESMLAKDPQDRPQSASEIVAAFRAIERGDPVPLLHGWGTRRGAGGSSSEGRAGRAMVPPRSREDNKNAFREAPPEQADGGEDSLIKVHPLPEGSCTVVVAEHPKDRRRRNRLRRQFRRRKTRYHRRHGRYRRGEAPASTGLLGGLKAAFSTPDPDKPEMALTASVAQEAGLPDDALVMSPEMLAPRFRLVADVDNICAERLSLTAKQWGFKSRVFDAETTRVGFNPFTAILAVVMFFLGLGVLEESVHVAIGVFIATLLVLRTVFPVRKQTAPEYPLAYGRDVSPYIEAKYRLHVGKAVEGDGASPAQRLVAVSPVVEREPEDGEAAETAPDGEPDRAPSEETSGQESTEEAGEPEQTVVGRAVVRTRELLAEFKGLLDSRRPELPDVILRDLDSTVEALTAQVLALGSQAEMLRQNLSSIDDSEEASAAARIEARIERLNTIRRTGAPVDMAELRRLEQVLAEHRHTLESIEDWETQNTRILARLLEIDSVVRQAMVDLQGKTIAVKSSQDLVGRLRVETKAAAQALQEVEPLVAFSRDESAGVKDRRGTQDPDEPRVGAKRRQLGSP